MKALITLCLAIGFVASVGAAQTNELTKALQPLQPFLKTWKGHFRNSTPEKPNFDVQRWERALNGRAVRIIHSVNNGAYGGESMIVANPKTAALEFYYFTTAGFYTHGTIEFQGGKVITHEEVTGNDDGVTKVKGTTELLPEGKLRVLTQYFKNGAWVDGRDMTYEETPAAEVLFR